jgi:hypothetical protein
MSAVVISTSTLRSLREQLGDVVADLERPTGTPDDALALYGELTSVARLAEAGLTLVAERAAQSDKWKALGRRSAAHHLAAIEGGTVGAAKRRVETSKHVEQLDATRTALAAGQLSTTQAEIVVRAAHADPTAEQALLDSAAVDTIKGLREKALNVEAAADPDPERTRQQARDERSCRFTTPRQGRGRIVAEGPLDEIVDIWTEIEPSQEAIFKRRYKAGGRESFDAYAYDAFRALIAAASGAEPDVDTPRPSTRRPKFVLVGTLDAFLRGHLHPGETVEIPGIGPYPLDAALAAAARGHPPPRDHHGRRRLLGGHQHPAHRRGGAGRAASARSRMRRGRLQRDPVPRDRPHGDAHRVPRHRRHPTLRALPPLQARPPRPHPPAGQIRTTKDQPALSPLSEGGTPSPPGHDSDTGPAGHACEARDRQLLEN